MAKRDPRMVPLGYGKFVRADRVFAVVPIEGEERYAKLQEFFSVVHRLASERRLSRFAYLAQKREAVTR